MNSEVICRTSLSLSVSVQQGHNITPGYNGSFPFHKSPGFQGHQKPGYFNNNKVYLLILFFIILQTDRAWDAFHLSRLCLHGWFLLKVMKGECAVGDGGNVYS